MKILYVDSDRIAKNDIIWGLLGLGIEVELFSRKVTMDEVKDEEVEALKKVLANYSLVITQNFLPAVAVACNDVRKPYASWIYDSPQHHLYKKEAFFDCNFIFHFDKKQVERLKNTGLKNVFHLPLAANVAKASRVSISDEDIRKLSCDISFIGSLYKRTTYDELITVVPEAVKKELVECLGKFSFDWREKKGIIGSLSDGTGKYLANLINDSEKYNMDKRYGAEILALCYKLANLDRVTLLKESASRFDTYLYTNEEVKLEEFPGLKLRGPVYEDDLYRAYYASKINLNVTIRSIETGIPQRIFDIMAVGGCVFSNYQEEIPEMFVPDKDIIVYSCMDEYLSKVEYYLKHEKERLRVCVNGYERVKNEYNYPKQLEKMINTVSEAV